MAASAIRSSDRALTYTLVLLQILRLQRTAVGDDHFADLRHMRHPEGGPLRPAWSERNEMEAVMIAILRSERSSK